MCIRCVTVELKFKTSLSEHMAQAYRHCRKQGRHGTSIQTRTPLFSISASRLLVHQLVGPSWVPYIPRGRVRAPVVQPRPRKANKPSNSFAIVRAPLFQQQVRVLLYSTSSFVGFLHSFSGSVLLSSILHRLSGNRNLYTSHSWRPNSEVNDSKWRD